MPCGKEVVLLLAVTISLLAASVAYAGVGDSFAADGYIYWIVANDEKNTFGFNETIPISGVLKRANISNTKNASGVNQTDYYGVGENFTINISVLNSSSNNSFLVMSQILVNTTGGGAFRTKSSSF
ncbi:hypothetical protein HYU15_03545, partial [Candidatus Woesearchaeota archaeon]|nr:hypothetical protein [Candidatus Woesearchaeota archaeon]